MFDTLLESRAVRQRSLGSQVASVVLHGALVGGAVLGTRHVVAAAPPVVVPESITYVTAPVVVQAEPPAAAAPPDVAPPNPPAAPPIVVPTIVAPISIPNVIPQIDVTREVVDYSVQRAANSARATAIAEAGGACRAVDSLGAARCSVTSDVYAENAVDKPAVALTGFGVPAYPDLLKQAGVEGRVRVSFVIDLEGRADTRTLTVLDASRPEFAESVRKALPSMRFLPAELRGRKVKQLVVLPFTFEIK